MSLRLRLSLCLLALGMPILASAAPGNVTGITAANEGGKVRVSWQAAAGTIQSYRIFYSHASILDNNGLFDDFETVDGSVNTHLLQNVPLTGELFVSVLAVDAAGEESPFFVEEAKTALAPAVSSAPISAGGTEMRLLKVEAISATGILLTFTHPVSVPQAQAAQAFIIENQSGATLTMRRFVMLGDKLTIHTVVQERGVVYRVRVSPAVTGKGAGGASIPLAGDQAPMLFTGHMTGTAPVTTVSAAGQRKDVTNLRINAQAQGGAYNVDMTWDIPAQQIAGYEIMQTTDGGRTFGAPASIQKDAGSIRIPGVPAGGTFGVLVRIVYPDGSRSNGIAQLLELPGSRPTVQANVVQPTVQTAKSVTSPSLPSSGPALWLALLGLSAIASAWRMHRRRIVAA